MHYRPEKSDMSAVWRNAGIFVLAALVIQCAGCDRGMPGTLEREDLFSLSIGKMEDEVDMIQLPGIPFNRRTRTVMQDGLIYIADGNTGKIMEFTSYGDLISLFYNPKQNPEPVMLSGTEDNWATLSNRRAYPYRFNEVGEIAVTEDKKILVEDRILEGRGEWDEDEGAMRDRIVLRFDRDGHFIDFLGTDGVGGSPFPYIEHIEGGANGEIAVISRGPESWFIYWFAASGDLLYTVRFMISDLPLPDDGDYVASLETIFPDRQDRRVYLKIDYYSKTVLRDSGGGNFVKSRIYIFDIDQERYVTYVDIPKNTWEPETPEFFDAKGFETLYTFLGETRDTLFLLSSGGTDVFHLLLLDLTGGSVAKKNIILKEDELIYRFFHLSQEGILTGFLCEEARVDIVWWRSDRLLEWDNEADR